MSYKNANANLKISTGQNVLNFLFFSLPSFSNKPKLGLKVQLKVQNIDLSITITHPSRHTKSFQHLSDVYRRHRRRIDVE